jgi:hypothetical protein
VKVVVTSCSTNDGTIKLDVLEAGKVMAHGSLRYDAASKAILDESKHPQRYVRRASEISADIRKELGL